MTRPVTPEVERVAAVARALREDAGLSPSGVAERTGADPRTILAQESCARGVGTGDLGALAALGGTTADSVMDRLLAPAPWATDPAASTPCRNRRAPRKPCCACGGSNPAPRGIRCAA